MKKTDLNNKQIKESAKINDFENNAKVETTKKLKTNLVDETDSKSLERESQKDYVRVVKHNEISLSSRSKNLINTALNTETGKKFMQSKGYTETDIKDIFSFKTIVDMYSSITIPSFEKPFLFQYAKYNSERDNGTVFEISDISEIQIRNCILDNKNYKDSELSGLFLKDNRLFITDNKNVLRVVSIKETISIYHIVQRVNTLKNERIRLKNVSDRLKAFEKKQSEKLQSEKDKKAALTK